MVDKSLYLTVLVIFFSCTQDLVYNSSLPNFDNRNIEWYYNSETQDLLIQIDVNEIGGENIDDIKVRISPDNDFFEIFDDGQNNDQISNNGIYSVVFNNIIESNHSLEIKLNMINGEAITYQYHISFNEPSIQGVVILDTIHFLNTSNWTDYEVRIAIDAPAGFEDIDDVKFYVKKIYFTESGELVNNICEYDDPVTNDYWETFDGWSMDWETINSSGYYIYKTIIPMRPINQCGGYGYVQWKFEVSNKKGFYDTFIYEEPVEICSGACEGSQ